MKKILYASTVILVLLFSQIVLLSDNNKTVPKVTIKDLFGKSIDASTINNDGKPFLIDFWATWCVPCVRELNNISKVYEKWQAETGIKFVAISIDDSRTSKKVAQFVKGKNWKFEFYLDENSDFVRAMGVNAPPHTFLVNGKGEIVWEHSGYAEGSEEEIIAKVKELLEKEKK